MKPKLSQRLSQKWFIFGAVSFAYFFVNFATFASLGVVLFTMADELHWSMTAAGFTFSLLGLACGLSSTLPTIAMKYVGARGSMAIGAALVFTMTAVTTINGVVVTHLVKLGSSPITAAWALGLLSFVGTLMKGGAGHLCETRSPKAFVVVGLLCQAAGCALLIAAKSTTVEFAAAVVFGVGWAFALVGGWVVLMRYFGGATGARLLAIVQLVTTIGAAGPISAGLIADRWGSFTPIFLLYAIILAALAVPVLLIRAPGAPDVEQRSVYDAAPAAELA